MIDYGKRNLLGVAFDAVDVESAVSRIGYFARLRRPLSVTALAVHGTVEAERDPGLAAALNDFDLVLPDGQAGRWALNSLYGLDLPEKVPGPTVVDRLLELAATEDMIVYFYGSTPETLAKIDATVESRFGGRLRLVSRPSAFRPVEPRELDQIVSEINASGASICFVGLGCPRQERFVAAVAGRLDMPSLAVGAAFDYIAGNIDRAPIWMQDLGLEWLYRLLQDPRRLARRYLTTNSRFIVDVTRQSVALRLNRSPKAPDSATPPGPPEGLLDA